MAGISNDCGAYQLQFAILGFSQVVLLATIDEQSKCRMLLCTIRTQPSHRSRYYQRCGHACLGWLCLLPMVSYWAKEVVNLQVASSCV